MCPQFVKWDTMHCVNLGVALWTCGSAMRVLLDDYDCWGLGGDGAILCQADRLNIAYDNFREWCRRHRVESFDTILCSVFLENVSSKVSTFWGWTWCLLWGLVLWAWPAACLLMIQGILCHGSRKNGCALIFIHTQNCRVRLTMCYVCKWLGFRKIPGIVSNGGFSTDLKNLYRKMIPSMICE